MDALNWTRKWRRWPWGIACGSALALLGCEECEFDADCPGGQVCEPSTGCEAPKQCVSGCRNDSECDAGERCNQVQCITCPCPGICEPVDTGCEVDEDCPSGQACALSTGCREPRQCVPGCRLGASPGEDSCPEGFDCVAVQCITCPCPALCLPVPGAAL